MFRMLHSNTHYVDSVSEFLEWFNRVGNSHGSSLRLTFSRGRKKVLCETGKANTILEIYTGEARKYHGCIVQENDAGTGLQEYVTKSEQLILKGRQDGLCTLTDQTSRVLRPVPEVSYDDG